jgi:hypothetical protein
MIYDNTLYWKDNRTKERDKIIEKLVRLYSMTEQEAKELIEKCSKPESAG